MKRPLQERRFELEMSVTCVGTVVEVTGEIEIWDGEKLLPEKTGASASHQSGLTRCMERILFSGEVLTTTMREESTLDDVAP